jgi:hypothetical protein
MSGEEDTFLEAGTPTDTGDSSYSAAMIFLIGFIVFLIPLSSGVFTWLGTYQVVNSVTGNYTLQGISPAVLLQAAGIVCPKVTTTTPCPACPTIADFGPVSIIGNGALSCASFGVIALNESGGAKDTLPLVDKLRNYYPLAGYSSKVLTPAQDPPSDSSQIPAWINNYFKPQLNALDLAVTDLFNGKKANLIHLPSSELLTTSFLTGQYSFYDGLNVKQIVSFFNGRSLSQRYPGQHFSVSDVAASVIDSLPNVARFSDVYTQFDPTILLPKMQVLGILPAPQNSALFFINQINDPRSIEHFSRTTSVLTNNNNGGFYSWDQIRSENITYSGNSNAGSFAPAAVTRVSSQIQSLLSLMSLQGSGPVKIVIVLNPGVSAGAQAAFAAAFDSALSSFNTDQRVQIWGLNFVPNAAMTVGFPVFRGLLPMTAQPTEDLSSLGFSRKPSDFGGQLGRQDLQLLDALKYASTCRGTVGLPGRPASVGATGNSVVFAPGTQTVIAEYLHDDGIIAPGSTAASNLDKGIQANGLWSKQTAAVPA